MTLQQGEELGPYEIVGKLGEGGMGVVWRARDARLGRDVALKVLPADVAVDPERRARFEREATVLASLNHPNIAGLYGLESDGDTLALVMELVEGPTLDQRMEQGPLPLDEALPIARQIAAALEEAHERGIVHRDLKPQNVKAPVDGTVKVLDFGLAKAIDPSADSPAPAGLHSPTFMNSPTLTAAGTQVGVILGTASYMAPEQARGIPLDRRADIWSFGVVLFEMLTGRRLFEGELVTDVLASVLRQDVDHAALPADTPPAIRRLLRRCLERRPKDRLRDIGDARLVIDEVLAGEDQAEPSSDAASDQVARRRPPWMLPVLIGAATLTGLLVGLTIGRRESSDPRATERPRETQLTLALPAGFSARWIGHPSLALSADGRRQAVTVEDADGTRHLLVRDLSIAEPWILEETEGALAPFFSPDGEWVGFFQGTGLFKVGIRGGRPVRIATASTNPRGATWSTDGFVYFAPDTQDPLQRVSEDGGPVTPVGTLQADRNERTQRWPSVLPDGSAVLFTSDTFESMEFYDDARIDAIRPESGERVTLVEGSSQARFLPPDRLLFARGGQLHAVRFDPRTLEVAGEPTVVLRDVATDVNSGAVQFALSQEGSLLWIPGSLGALSRNIQRYSATNDFEPIPVPLGPDRYTQIAVAPDGARLALAVMDDARATDLWIADLEKGTMTRRTFDGRSDGPTWTPDGKRLAFSRVGEDGEERGIFTATANGGEEPVALVSDPGKSFASSFSPDGETLLYERAVGGGRTGLWQIGVDGTEPGRPLPGGQPGFHAEISPDGHWLVYLNDQGLLIRPFPEGAGRWQIVPLGFEPHWSPDGRQIYYRLGGELHRVDVILDDGVAIGASTVVLGRTADNGLESKTYAVGPDGSIWTTRGSANETGDARIQLIIGWKPGAESR